MSEGFSARTLMRKLYEFEVSADPTWLARGFGDELGLYLEAKLKSRPNLSKVEASGLVRLVVRKLKDQASVTGKVVRANLQAMMTYEVKYYEAHEVYPWGLQVFTDTVLSDNADTLEELFQAIEAGPFWIEAMHLRPAKCIEGVFEEPCKSDQCIEEVFDEPGKFD
jgi:hypothetical protein